MPLHRLLVSVCLVASLSAQNEVLYYKFEGGGSVALNYVPASPAPGSGAVTNTLTTAPTSNFVPGRFGEALNSAASASEINFVNTGWSPSVTGSYTYAMFLRNSRGTPAPNGWISYIAGIPVSFAFRIFTGNSFIRTTGGAGGVSTNYSSVANVYQMATAGWVHVAFVVDTARSTATYYINGVAEPSMPLAGPVSISGPTFTIGRQLYLTGFPNIYDIDEFRFVERAVSAAAIATWATTDGAGAAEFGQGCGGASLSSSGLPQIGNVGYGLSISSGPPGSAGVLAFGFSRTTAGPFALPLDLGQFLPVLAGCFWECSQDVTTLVVLDAAGSGSVPFALPAVQSYVGVVVNAQALFIGGPVGAMSTNAVGMAVGN